MKRFMKRLVVVAVCVAALAGTAIAEEKLKGSVKSVDTASGTIVVTDSEGKDVPVVLEDKSKAGKYGSGDKVKVKYNKKDGKNMATDFRKVEGC